MADKRVRWDINDEEIRHMVERMKGELAQELGMSIPPDGYWGHYKSKDLGKIGSQLQKRVPLLLEWKRKKVKKDE